MGGTYSTHGDMRNACQVLVIRTDHVRIMYIEAKGGP